MKALVVYKSKTGFTKRYAEMIAAELGCQAAGIEEVSADSLSRYDTIIFGGSLYIGKILGIKKAKELVQKANIAHPVFFAVGASPVEDTEGIEGVWKDALSAEELASVPHFYMQGGLSYERMSAIDKFLMHTRVNMSKKALAKDPENPAKKLEYEMIQKSYDSSSKDYILPLVTYVKELIL